MGDEMTARVAAGGVVRALSLCLLAVVFARPATGAYGGGAGTSDHPFLIFTAQHLAAIGREPDDWDKHFRLMADIDLGNQPDFPVIGTTDEGPFSGVFDGNQKAISGLQQRSEYEGYRGLFGLVDGDEARIANLALIRPSVRSDTGRYIGAMAGFLRDGTIANCHVRAGEITGMSFVGGLVGKNEGGFVADCTVSGRVCGITRVGGLVGQSYFGETTQCRTVGQVVGLAQPVAWFIGGLIGENSNSAVAECRACCTVTGNSYVGGLTGDNLLSTVDRSSAEGAVTGDSDVGGLAGRSNGGTFTDSYALAEVTGSEITGGLIGRHGPSCYCKVYEPGLVTRCYAAGPVKGPADGGGLIGLNERSITEDSFWDIETTGCKSSDGGEGKTTSQMRDRTTYWAAGWDLVAGDNKKGPQAVWRMTAKAYPRLEWEGAADDFNADGRVDLRDYALFARQWRQLDAGFWSNDAAITRDGVVDHDDLADFARAWLGSSSHMR